jgi:hypothetical protein
MAEGKESGKKAWQKPELTVLVRGKPEESVLAACKWAGYSYPAGAWTDCWTNSTTFCTALAAS